MVELFISPEEDWVGDRDQFIVEGCRVSLIGAHIRVERQSGTTDAQAVADEYVAALREHVGGITRMLTAEEFTDLPARQITVRGSDGRTRARRRIQIARARGELVSKRHPRLSQCYDYFESAVDDADHALSHLYKLVESVEAELGGEQEAKKQLDAATQVSTIKRLANDRSEQSRDQRHAPRTPGTGVELTNEELSRALQAGDFILRQFERMVMPAS
jgi:hypothetical protein